MSTPNEPGSVDGVKEGLGKLASQAPADGDVVPGPIRSPLSSEKWVRAKQYIRKGILVLALLLICFLFAVGGLFLRNPTIRGMVLTMLGSRKQLTHFWDPTAAYNLSENFPIAQQRKSLTVLVLGCDHDSEKGIRLKGHNAVPVPDRTGPGRSDANMIARFEFDGDTITSLNVLSIPRDTRVRIPGHGIHKFNAAHAYGGPELTIATVRDVFGIDPDYYVDLDFEGFQQVVDAVGGVDVDVQKKMDYEDKWGNLYIHLTPGPQHMDGYKAMGYVRFRHTDNDLMRAQRQHEFLEALRSKVTSPKSFLALPAVVGAISENLHSNLSMPQMLTLANLSRKAPKDAVCIETLPVVEGKTFVYIDKRRSADVIHKMFFKNKLIAEVPLHTPANEPAPVRSHKRHGVDVKKGDKSDSRSKPLNPIIDEPTAPTFDVAAQGKTTDNSTAKSDKHENSDKPAPADMPIPDNSSPTGDIGKPPAKGKTGTGTSWGKESSILRG